MTAPVIENAPDLEVAPAEEYAIEIEGMYKRYGRFHAVRDLSMHVPVGSVYGFVGPNGAGKTTTIRTLATLQSPDSGSVRLAGFDVTHDPSAVRDRLGYMPDFFGVYESLTVWEYLDFYGASHGIRGARRKQICDELLELVDLADKRSLPVEVLSRGMKQRLGLARCLIHDPEVLLLDEPASGMDPRARIELREIVRELGSLNKTILISSHILPELAEMCTHIGIIRSGQVIAEGPVDAVISSLTTGPELRISVLHARDLDRVTAFLDEGFAGPERLGDRSVRIPYSDTDEVLSRLLATIVSEGIPLTSFHVERASLEDVFLQITELGEEDA